MDDDDGKIGPGKLRCIGGPISGTWKPRSWDGRWSTYSPPRTELQTLSLPEGSYERLSAPITRHRYRFVRDDGGARHFEYVGTE